MKIKAVLNGTVFFIMNKIILNVYNNPIKSIGREANYYVAKRFKKDI